MIYGISIKMLLKLGGVAVIGLCVAWMLITRAQLSAARSEIKAKDELISVMETRAKVQEENVETLEQALVDQNALVLEAAVKGREAQEAQALADQNARKLAAARKRLEALQTEHEALLARAVGLDACQTYELVLRSFAEGVIP